MWARFLITLLLCAVASVVVLSGGPALAGPAVLLDDHFEGSELNTSLWGASGGTFGVSGSRLTITPSAGGFACLQGEGHKYSRARFEDVRIHQMGHDFLLDFGYTGALSGNLSLQVDNAGTLMVGAWQGGPNISWGQSLGAFENATFEIVWWKDYLGVLKDNATLFSTTDPGKIPTYDSMGLGCYVRDGVVSFDRITMTEIVPEPATLILAGSGALGLLGLLRRRRSRGTRGTGGAMVLALLATALVMMLSSRAQATAVQYVVTNDFSYGPIQIAPYWWPDGIACDGDRLLIDDIGIEHMGLWEVDRTGAAVTLNPAISRTPFIYGLAFDGTDLWANDGEQVKEYTKTGTLVQTFNPPGIGRIDGLDAVYHGGTLVHYLLTKNDNGTATVNIARLTASDQATILGSFTTATALDAIAYEGAWGSRSIVGAQGKTLYTFDNDGTLLGTQTLGVPYGVRDLSVAYDGKMYLIDYGAGIPGVQERIYEATPIPEPATMTSALVGMGALIALGRRRRKHG